VRAYQLRAVHPVDLGANNDAQSHEDTPFEQRAPQLFLHNTQQHCRQAFAIDSYVDSLQPDSKYNQSIQSRDDHFLYPVCSSLITLMYK
jgi:hypothetical protein